VRDPLKGWTRKDTALADSFSMQDPLIAGTAFGLELVEVGQAGLAAQVSGTVDDGLDAHRATVFEVLLDPGMLIEHVDDHPTVVPAVDRGTKGARGVPTDATVEDDLDVVRSAEIEVVGHQGFEETTGMSGCVEHDGAGDLDLPHGGFPPVACVPILGRERQGETRQPAFDEHSYRPRTKSITDLLHGDRILAGGESVGQLGEPIPAWVAWRLAHSCPLSQILAG
jgi:hypothetical protein